MKTLTKRQWGILSDCIQDETVKDGYWYTKDELSKLKQIISKNIIFTDSV